MLSLWYILINGFGSEFEPVALIVKYYRYIHMKLSTVYYKGVLEGIAR